ncbi:MAG: hypothetical protein C5B59_19150 [Bacteroidetes bacterium]|nr:MAG: hypothetical protein C5B59_19150 [Bacteroidota bacterium]
MVVVAYARILVGCLTGVTRTPFTSAMIVLEMTDRHSMIFCLMVAAMEASIVAVVGGKHSFYDRLKFHCLREVAPDKQWKKPG